jgi:hypothetical protein
MSGAMRTQLKQQTVDERGEKEKITTMMKGKKKEKANPPCALQGKSKVNALYTIVETQNPP